MTLTIIVLSFFIYSFIGWIYESAICSLINEKRLTNRGFLYGPYCPIYGTGAVLSWFLLKDISNALLIFFLAAIICSTLEYVTSTVMEKLFNRSWWDYSNLPLNIDGKICLYAGVFFGVAVVIEVLYLHPIMLFLLSQIEGSFLAVFAIILLFIWIIDFFITITHRHMTIKEFNWLT